MGKNLTPNIKNLLESSIYFENCIVNSTWTLPSHFNMFTGLYSSQLRLLSYFLHNLSNKLPVLTEIIKDLGYHTICYTENPWINKFFRLTRGFDNYFKNCRRLFEVLEETKIFQHFVKFTNIIDTVLLKKIKINFISFYWQHFKKLIEELVKRIIKSIYWKNWLFETKDTLGTLDQFAHILHNKINKQPLYLFFNIMAAHYPYIPIKEALDYCDFYKRDFKTLKKLLLYIRKEFIKINIRSQHLSKKKVKALTKLYSSCVYYNDLIVGKLISILRKSGLIEHSYIIITADHGEHLSSKSDHYYYGHGVDQSAYESLIKVPLIIYHPDFKKRIIKNQVEMKDLFHTILHLTGIPKAQNKYLNIDQSILYQINNNSTPEYIFGEHLKEKREMKLIINQSKKFIEKEQFLKIYYDIYYLRSNRYKYINFENKIEEFYDLNNDPDEQINIINKRNENLDSMKTYMTNFIKHISNIDNLERLITQKEKDILEKNIAKIKIEFNK